MQGLQDNFKRCDISIMGISEGEQKEGTEKIKVILTENCSK